jgi:Fic family protein
MKPHFLDGLNDGLKLTLMNSLRDLWCHMSTAIEGNSLSLGDTQFILDEGLTISGKPLKDHNEIHGHAKAIDLVYAMLDKDLVTEQDIFLLHKAVVTENVSDIYQPIGAWKAESNYTNYVTQAGKSALREYPAYIFTPKLMGQWLEKCNNAFNQAKSQEAVVRAYADLHLCFVTVHPFFDGNGRMARLMSNLPVLKAGFPPIIVPKEDRKRYRETISAYQQSIADLAGLRDLAQLPVSESFIRLCEGYWTETLDLVESARQLQANQAAREKKQASGFGLG